MSTPPALAERGQQILHTLRRGFLDPDINRRLARGVSVVLLVLVAWTAAGLTWQWLRPATLPPTASGPAQPLREAPTTKPVPIQDVVSAHLFGTADAVPVKTKGPIVAPETRLRLVLHGVFASDDPALALALIAEKGGRDKAYRHGDKLPGGAALHAIYPDRVILSRAGKLETLKLKRRPRAEVRRAGSQSATRPTRKTVRRVPQLQQVRKLYHDDPRKLLKQIRITPVMKNGQLVGYRFNHNDRALMRAAGLLPQDVITEINGVSVQDTSAMFSLLRNLDDLQQLQLVILRRGIPQQLTLTLN